MSVVSPILRGTVLPCKAVCVCRGGYDRWINQEFVLRYQRDGEGGSSKIQVDGQNGG